MAKQNGNLASRLSIEDLLDSQTCLDTHAGQEASMFRALKARKGDWVSLPELGRVGRSRAVGSVMSNLRKRGCVIENQNHHVSRQENGEELREIESWYRLVKEPGEVASDRAAKQQELQLP